MTTINLVFEILPCKDQYCLDLSIEITIYWNDKIELVVVSICCIRKSWR